MLSQVVTTLRRLQISCVYLSGLCLLLIFRCLSRRCVLPAHLDETSGIRYRM